MDPIIIGALSSVVAEILKLVPQLNSSSLVKSVVVFAVALVGTYFFGSLTTTDFATTIASALVTYLAIVKPAAEYTGFKTQV